MTALPLSHLPALPLARHAPAPNHTQLTRCLRVRLPTSQQERKFEIPIRITFCARKEQDVEVPPSGREVPDWLRHDDLPVPALPQFRAQSLSTHVYAFLLAMIDGERTIRDMARLMEQQKLMTAVDAEPAIRRFLIRALEQTDQRPGS